MQTFKVTSLLGFVVFATATVLAVGVFFAPENGVLAQEVNAGVAVMELVSVKPVDAMLPVAELKPVIASEAPFGWPMVGALSRVMKKPFGLEIVAGHSPVPNDRFTGFHVGVDFETSVSEQETDVPVYAICDGPLVMKDFAKGYGGFAVQKCELNGEPVTIVYGHMNLVSITAMPSERLAKGQFVGFLGRGNTEETDGVRKHLHLGLHPGTNIDIRGYVKEQTDTGMWLNALEYMPK